MKLQHVKAGFTYAHSWDSGPRLAAGEGQITAFTVKRVDQNRLGNEKVFGSFEGSDITGWITARRLHGDYDTVKAAREVVQNARNATRTKYDIEESLRHTAADNVAGFLSTLGVHATVVIDTHGPRDESGIRMPPTFGLRIGAVETIRLGDELARMRQASA